MGKYIKECGNGGLFSKTIEEHKEKLFRKKEVEKMGKHSGNVNHGIILNYRKKSN